LSFEHDTNSNVPKIAVAKNFTFFICFFLKLIIEFEI
jgi:hypothetical protein